MRALALGSAFFSACESFFLFHIQVVPTPSRRGGVMNSHNKIYTRTQLNTTFGIRAC